jgi:hypothetical protein
MTKAGRGTLRKGSGCPGRPRRPPLQPLGLLEPLGLQGLVGPVGSARPAATAWSDAWDSGLVAQHAARQTLYHERTCS